MLKEVEFKKLSFECPTRTCIPPLYLLRLPLEALALVRGRASTIFACAYFDLDDEEAAERLWTGLSSSLSDSLALSDPDEQPLELSSE